MAYDKIIPIRRRLDHCLDYARDKEKTGGVLETALNCRMETAYQEMVDTKHRWDKQGGVLGYHIIHAYAPGEVTPQEAHTAGVEFARRLLGGNYEAVVCTHTDREHLHCHIVYNSVSFVDGGKYRNDFKAYFGGIRECSNEVSREYGLSVIEANGGGKHYAEWSAEKRGKATLRGLIRQDIDTALGRAYTRHSFWMELEKLGYEVKYGENVKYPAVKPPGSARFVRLTSLGEDYTEARLWERLEQSRSTVLPVAIPCCRPPVRRCGVRGNMPLHARRPRSFRGLYYYYLHFLRSREKTERPPPFAVRREVIRLRRYAEQFYFLRKYRIDTPDQLSTLADALQAEADTLTGRRKELYEWRQAGEDVEWELEQINQDLRPVRRELKLCARIEKDISQIRENLRLYRAAQTQEQEQAKTKERGQDRWR